MAKKASQKRVSRILRHMWTQEQAIELVRTVQLESRTYGYHVALGGGCINKGYSDKDVDVYFLRLDDEGPADILGLISWLEALWGESAPINEFYIGDSKYRQKRKFFIGTKRIDAFIV